MVIAVLLVVAVGCAADDGAVTTATDSVPVTESSVGSSAPSTDDGGATSLAPTTTDADHEGSDVQPQPIEPFYDVGDIDLGLQPFIDQAAADLAVKLGVDVGEITTHAAVLVVWPDASLGCPQPDMQYAQAQTDGSIIELELDGSIYRYHTGGARGPFICDQPVSRPPSG